MRNLLISISCLILSLSSSAIYYDQVYKKGVFEQISSTIKMNINPTVEDSSDLNWFAHDNNAENSPILRRFQQLSQDAIDRMIKEGKFNSVKAISIIKIADSDLRRFGSIENEFKFSSEILLSQGNRVVIEYTFEPNLRPFWPVAITLTFGFLVILFKSPWELKLAKSRSNHSSISSVEIDKDSKHVLFEPLFDIAVSQGFEHRLVESLINGLSDEWKNYLITQKSSNQVITELINDQNLWASSTEWYDYLVNIESLSPKVAFEHSRDRHRDCLSYFEKLRQNEISFQDSIEIVNEDRSVEFLDKYLPLIIHNIKHLNKSASEVLDGLYTHTHLSLIHSKKSVEIYGVRFELKPRTFSLYYFLVDQNIKGYPYIKCPTRIGIPEFDECLHIYYRNLPRASTAEPKTWALDDVRKLVNELNHELRIQLCLDKGDADIFSEIFVDVLENSGAHYLNVPIGSEYCEVHSGNQSSGPGSNAKVISSMKKIGIAKI